MYIYIFNIIILYLFYLLIVNFINQFNLILELKVFYFIYLNNTYVHINFFQNQKILLCFMSDFVMIKVEEIGQKM